MAVGEAVAVEGVTECVGVGVPVGGVIVPVGLIEGVIVAVIVPLAVIVGVGE